MSPASESKRGRPLKFGRRAQLVTLTLPDDVITWLASIDRDLAWAVVKLHERSQEAEKKKQDSLADLVQLPGHRALILVKPEPFQNLEGLSIIPLADGRGFLALDQGKGVADLEIAVIDRLETKGLAAAERVLGLQHDRGMGRIGAVRLGWFVVTQAVVLCAWVFFRSSSFTNAMAFMANVAVLDFPMPNTMMWVGTLFLVPLALHHAWAWAEERGVVRPLTASSRAALAAVMVYGIVTLYAGTSDFIYFQF